MKQDISFRSRFKPVNNAEYRKITSAIDPKFFVDFPWTVKENSDYNKIKNFILKKI